jgi:hypothetical protein
LEIVRDEKDLGDVAAVTAKRALPRLDEATLADGSDGLQVGQLGWPANHSEPSHPCSDGARTHQHDLPAGLADRIDLTTDGVDACRIEKAVGSGQHAGTDLHDDQTGGRRNLLAEVVVHGPWRGGSPIEPWKKGVWYPEVGSVDTLA